MGPLGHYSRNAVRRSQIGLIFKGIKNLQFSRGLDLVDDERKGGMRMV